MYCEREREERERERERKKNEEVCGCAFEKKHHEREIDGNVVVALRTRGEFITYIAVP